MGDINKKTIILSIFFIFSLAFTCDYWFPAKIDEIYQSEFESDDGSFVVTIKNPPLTKQSMLVFWYEHKKEILKKIGILNDGKGILFVRNKFEKTSHEEAVQFCLSKQIKEEKSCINYDDRLFIAEHQDIERTEGYRLTFSDYYQPTSCAIYDRDDGIQEYYNCDGIK